MRLRGVERTPVRVRRHHWHASAKRNARLIAHHQHRELIERLLADPWTRRYLPESFLDFANSELFLWATRQGEGLLNRDGGSRSKHSEARGTPETVGAVAS